MKLPRHFSQNRTIIATPLFSSLLSRLGTDLCKVSFALGYGVAQRLLTFLTAAFLRTASFTTLGIALQLA